MGFFPSSNFKLIISVNLKYLSTKTNEPSPKGQGVIVPSFAFWFEERLEKPPRIPPSGCSSPCLLWAVLISLILAISKIGG